MLETIARFRNYSRTRICSDSKLFGMSFIFFFLIDGEPHAVNIAGSKTASLQTAY